MHDKYVYTYNQLHSYLDAHIYMISWYIMIITNALETVCICLWFTAGGRFFNQSAGDSVLGCLIWVRTWELLTVSVPRPCQSWRWLLCYQMEDEPSPLLVSTISKKCYEKLADEFRCLCNWKGEVNVWFSRESLPVTCIELNQETTIPYYSLTSTCRQVVCWKPGMES